MRALVLVIACVLGSSAASAQLKRVAGQVFDREDGEPMPGVTVRVDGTKIAAATDIDGNFVLTGADFTGKTLSFFYTGYDSCSEKASADMKIYMTQHPEMMDEVIVVAFGKQKRESFTGSASVVTAADISRQQVTNPVEALNGRVSGLQMTDNNSLSSSDSPTIRVRGFSSINASNSPLIVVDGMPYSGYMNDINPADIENMTVLKDAASNALYGARGANGVILITTKNAQRGNTKVTLDAKWGVNHDARVKYDIITDPGQYYEAHYLALNNYYRYNQGMSAEQAHMQANSVMGKDLSEGGLGYMVYSVPVGQYLIGSNGRLNPSATLGNRVAYNNEVYTLYPDNWEDAGLRDGLRQEYNLNLTGGNEKYSIMASLGYLDNEGISYGSGMKRISSRLKVNYQAYSFLRMGATAGYTNTNSTSGSAVFSTAYNIAPIYPLFIRDANGNIMYDQHGMRYDYGYNDVGLTRPVEPNGNSIQDDRLDISTNSSNAFNIQGFATIDFLKDFHLTVNGSVYVTENRSKVANPGYYGYDVATGGTTRVAHSRTTDTNYQQLLNYNKVLGAHNIDVLLGHEYSRWVQTSLSGTKMRIADFEANTELSGAIITQSTSSSRSLYNVEGYFLRGQYDYDSRYFFSGSFRRDGSSRFHPKHRWGNFWSLGGAWIITKEEWFPNSPMVNMLKYKISYGEQGNDGIGNFRYVDIYDIKNSNDEVSFIFSTKGNENITWETVGSFNTGLEFELFNQRLQGGIEYYYRKTRDMLMSFSVPYEMGYSSYYDNVGDMANSGIELELNGDILKARNFTWSLGLNLTWQRNRITYIPSEKAGTEMEGHMGYQSGSYFYGEGLPMYTYYMKRYAGLDENGQALYYTQDKDGNMGTTSRYDSASYFLCGNPLPKIFGGFNTNIKIYDFDISAQFNYSVGGKKVDSGYEYLMTAPTAMQAGRGLHKDVFNTWTPDNPSADIRMFTYNDVNSASLCDYYLTDASYLTFRNLSVGYTFPRSVTNRLKMQRLRVFGLCENVAYWTKRKGFDPRAGITTASFGAYSPMRTISGGIQVQF